MPHSVYKKVGETPLEALERFRLTQGIAADVPMTYAGRLDPMAEGTLIILAGDECKDKEKYLEMGKVYEVEIVFGISTDTYDGLGLPMKTLNPVKFKTIDLEKYVVKFTQAYPPYSSKTVAGKQLHELARSNELPQEMPTREVEIYQIDLIELWTITSEELFRRLNESIRLVKGDFRQKEILEAWEKVLHQSESFQWMKIGVSCSSGTYMRSLADQIGKDIGAGAFALGINRTRVGGFGIN